MWMQLYTVLIVMGIVLIMIYTVDGLIKWEPLMRCNFMTILILSLIAKIIHC